MLQQKKKVYRKSVYMIGIDEVGRGALAGPVVVAAALVPMPIKGKRAPWIKKGPGPLRDSKQLTATAREAWSRYLKKECADEVIYATARVYPRGIERLNISRAANHAAERALAALLRKTTGIKHKEKIAIYLDGGLFLGSRVAQKQHFPRAVTRPKADATVPAVAAASIIAKVERDRFMTTLACRHPAYGFEAHKGYGTAVHRAAITLHGPCDAHRLTFLASAPIMKGRN